MKYSNRIAHVRKSRGLSQTHLAEAIGATLSMVGKIERGERKLTSTWIEKICVALRCRPSDLLDEDAKLIPAGEITAGGRIALSDSGSGLPEMEGITWGKGSFDPAESSLRSLVVAAHPIAIAVPVGSEIIYDVLEGDPFVNRLGELCMAFVRPPEGVFTPILCILMPGSEPDRYHVAPVGGEYIENAEVQGTFRITSIKLNTH
mgnify:CR=1 FL=1